MSTRKSEIVKESDTSYIFNGNTDVDLLEKLLGVRPDEKEATTIAGLVSELAGHIPKAGEVFEENGLTFEVWNRPSGAWTGCALALRAALPAPQAGQGTSMAISLRICLHHRPPQRRQIDAAECAGRREARHRHAQAADHAQPHPGND